MKKIFSFVFIFMNLIMYAQSEPCYEESKADVEYDAYVDYFYRYTGKTPNEKGVKPREIVIKEGENRWEKKKADKICLSADPEDCLVWCLVTEPRESIILYQVTDTTLVSEYALDSILKFEITYYGYEVKTEVICPDEADELFITILQNALADKGCGFIHDGVGVYGSTTKQSLMLYQLENNLPVGNLDLKTLESLGVSRF